MNNRLKPPIQKNIRKNIINTNRGTDDVKGF